MHTLKVVWQEGMLLRPQHFQQNDRYHDHQLKARTRLLELYAWGFFSLEIDRQFLALGKLVLSRASGLLPDGSLFEIGSADEPLILDVPPNTSTQPVYLALPLVTGNHVESRRPEQQDVLARYRTQDLEVADSNAGEDNASPISCGRQDFHLLLGDSTAQRGYVCLKVAEILERGPEGTVVLDPLFSATVLHYQACPFLLSCLKETISLLGYRGDRLAERMRAIGRPGADVTDVLMLQLINRYEAQLRHYLSLEQLHPEWLYRELVALLGELATFSSEHKRPSLEWRYLHNDQCGSFRTLMEALRQILSTVLEQQAIELALQQRQYGISVAPLPDRSLLESAVFILVAGAQCDPEELRKRLPGHLKIGAVERIRQLVNLHLPGIRLRPLPVAPRQLPFHAGKAYFALELGSEERAQLENSGGFAFHTSGDFAGLELAFWAIRS